MKASENSASDQSHGARNALDPVDLIALVYRLILGREIEPAMLATRVDGLKEGILFADMFVEIATSEEAVFRARELTRILEERDQATAVSRIVDDSRVSLWVTIIAAAYEHILRRKPGEADIEQWVKNLKEGLSVERFFEYVVASEEANRVKSLPHGSRPESDQSSPVPIADDSRSSLWTTIIAAAYEHLLRRKPGEHDIEQWVKNLKEGLSVERFFEYVVASEEANRARSLRHAPRLGPDQSDGEFLLGSSQLLFGRGLTPREVVFLQNAIAEVPEKRDDFAAQMINEHLKKVRLSEATDGLPYDATTFQIMGTTRTLTKRDWEERRAHLLATNHTERFESERPTSATPRVAFEHTGSFKVSMIASLYKGGQFIRQFLDNVTSQSLFDSAELIIVDANSPEHEHDVIKEYQKQFPNIVYKRINYRIGIYEAWNLCVECARGRYLTSTNLDDLRRSDSIALQATVLDQNDEVDVVYQDFYYSLEPHLTFDEIAAFGFKSELPIITPHNLLLFNSPHNAPMWRASLHGELGVFDTRYRSAGDYEFWARCLANGKKFRKINSPHVVYYQNPEGISTRPDTRGIAEAHDILTRYSGKLISPSLLQSRRDFRVSLGVDLMDETIVHKASYYDVVQSALLRLGTSRPATDVLRAPEDNPRDPVDAVAP